MEWKESEMEVAASMAAPAGIFRGGMFLIEPPLTNCKPADFTLELIPDGYPQALDECSTKNACQSQLHPSSMDPLLYPQPLLPSSHPPFSTLPPATSTPILAVARSLLLLVFFFFFPLFNTLFLPLKYKNFFFFLFARS